MVKAQHIQMVHRYKSWDLFKSRFLCRQGKTTRVSSMTQQQSFLHDTTCYIFNFLSLEYIITCAPVCMFSYT